MAEQGTDIEKAKINVRTAIIMVVVIVGWVLSLAAVYFPMAQKVNDGNLRLGKLEAQIAGYNLNVLVYQVNELREQVKQSNSKTDEILVLLRGR